MDRILILGGTGLLGEPVARRLQADGFAVRLLARDPDKARPPVWMPGSGRKR